MAHVQFSDETKTKIISWFNCQQDASEWDNLGEVEDDDPRLVEFFDSSATQ